MTIQTLVVGPISTNCYILTDDDTGKCVIIDPGAKSMPLQNAIERAGSKNVEAIILTHGHFDHIGGLPFVMERTKAPVCIHEADARFLCADGPNPHGTMRGADVIPELMFSDGQTIQCGGLTLSVMHTPGHTPGSCCIICGDTIFSGDTLFFHDIGRADFAYSDFQAELCSIGRLRALPGDYKVLPGHGRPTTLSEEREHNSYMKR